MGVFEGDQYCLRAAGLSRCTRLMTKATMWCTTTTAGRKSDTVARAIYRSTFGIGSWYPKRMLSSIRRYQTMFLEAGCCKMMQGFPNVHVALHRDSRFSLTDLPFPYLAVRSGATIATCCLQPDWCDDCATRTTPLCRAANGPPDFAGGQELVPENLLIIQPTLSRQLTGLLPHRRAQSSSHVCNIFHGRLPGLHGRWVHSALEGAIPAYKGRSVHSVSCCKTARNQLLTDRLEV